MADLGYTSVLQGRLAEGRALLEEAISVAIRMGALRNHSRWVAWFRAEACRLAGRGEEAWQYARQALDLAQQQKERGNEALALHQLGVVHAHAAPPMSRRPKPPTSRPWAWLQRSAYARSRPTVTAVLVCYMPRRDNGRRPMPSCPPPSRCTTRWR
jgi:hypothetical protein